MANISKTFKMVLVVISLILSNLASGNDIPYIPSSIEISSRQKSIRVGDPLILKLVYKFEKPQISIRTGNPLTSFSHSAYLKIEHHGGSFSTDRFPIFPTDLYLQDKSGLEYSRQLVFLYHFGEKRLLFSEAGIYTVTVKGRSKTPSNPLNITVEPSSESQRRALSLLSDPNDYFFLEFGIQEYPERRPDRISNLKRVVKQCGDTLLVKWAAARLGIEESKEVEEKYSDSKKFWDDYRQGKIIEPLVGQAHSHLSSAYKLPDEFLIRDEVLYQLTKIEFIKGNYKKVLSLVDELEAKYPNGEYGKRISRQKTELQELIKKTEVEKRPRIGLPRLVLPILSILAAGIVLTGLVLLKKKVASSSK